MAADTNDNKKTVFNDEICTSRVGRRSAIGLIGGSFLSFGAIGTFVPSANSLNLGRTVETRSSAFGDTDTGRLADVIGNGQSVETTTLRTPESDAADIDVTMRGDPILEVDIDPTDRLSDADRSYRGDTADQD